MTCPKCGSPDTYVIESRATAGTIRRRRECKCSHRFTTYEANEKQWKAIQLIANLVKEILSV